jgi:Protein kinase domain
VVQIIGVLDGMLAGLAHAGEHGIVHRDLKPENVMCTGDGGVKIADFGIAKAYDRVAAANLTPPGEFNGSPAYVSPEQVRGAAATPASDLYAVGVIAFELLTGKVPFEEHGFGTPMLLAKLDNRAPRMRSRRPDLDGELAEWVDRLLERYPGKRPPGAREAGDSLEDIAERLFGARWRRKAALPEAPPLETPVTSAAVPAARIVSTGTALGHAPFSALAANALSRPFNLGAALVIGLIAAIFTPWLFAIVVAVAVYLGLAAVTFHDVAESVRVGRRA